MASTIPKVAGLSLILDMLDDGSDDDQACNEAANTAFLASTAISVLPGNPKSRIIGYIETVVPGYTNTDFRRMFRVSPSTFCVLLREIENFVELQPAGPGGREAIPIIKQLHLTLWYMGGTDTITKVADRFGLSESSVVLCRNRILLAILKLTHKLVVWPNAEQQIVEAEEFEKRNGFPGIIGAIDGTHIRIKSPSVHPQSYVNRKGFHSIQLQCVCKHNMLFSDIYTGYPGSCHDARVLKNSDLWQMGAARFTRDNHILGDGAYPLRSWLLVPFRDNGHLTRQQKKYNYCHSSNRVVIERAFALLKNRFRRLQFIDTPKMSTAVDIIMAACILHNLCILENDAIEEFLTEDATNNDVDNTNRAVIDDNEEGRRKRDTISLNLI